MVPEEAATMAAMYERARLEGRAEAFDDAAAIIRGCDPVDGPITAEDWLRYSYTFSNEAIRIRRELEKAVGDL